ncbi:hypothetical protein BSG1_08426 [Bacillus sp. SG-1]|nr:hypothetical protein BSG1_08426 [Bacillus sp. SG-1]
MHVFERKLKTILTEFRVLYVLEEGSQDTSSGFWVVRVLEGAI